MRDSKGTGQRPRHTEVRRAAAEPVKASPLFPQNRTRHKLNKRNALANITSIPIYYQPDRKLHSPAGSRRRSQHLQNMEAESTQNGERGANVGFPTPQTPPLPWDLFPISGTSPAHPSFIKPFSHIPNHLFNSAAARHHFVYDDDARCFRFFERFFKRL